jgi:hypothetical protein
MTNNFNWFAYDCDMQILGLWEYVDHDGLFGLFHGKGMPKTSF